MTIRRRCGRPRRAPSRLHMAGMRRFARAGHLHAAGDRAGRHPDGLSRRPQVHARQQVRLSSHTHTHPPPLPTRACTRSWIHWDIKPGNIGAAQRSEFKKRTLPRNGGVRPITPREAPRPVVRAHISPGHHCRTVPQWFTISGCPCNSRARKRRRILNRSERRRSYHPYTAEEGSLYWRMRSRR